MLYRTTPAGARREELTGRILDCEDQEYAREILEDEIPTNILRNERHAKRSNGGGAIDNRDLCAMLTVSDLETVARKLGV